MAVCNMTFVYSFNNTEIKEYFKQIFMVRIATENTYISFTTANN